MQFTHFDLFIEGRPPFTSSSVIVNRLPLLDGQCVSEVRTPNTFGREGGREVSQKVRPDMAIVKVTHCEMSRPDGEMSLSERFNALRQEAKDLQSKTSQFEQDALEHQRVLETIAKMPEDRTCYRQVGEVLVQMNIGQARVALEQHHASLKELVTTFQQKTEAKQKELLDFQKEKNIQIRSLRELQGGNA